MSSKSELTKTIENQQLRITRLEQRLSDVVTAYKNLQKEKDALDSTIRVLSTTKVENRSDLNQDQNVESTNDAENLQTLQQNVAVITEQKNRMEQMFQLDKRKLKNENEELKKLLEETKAENIINKEKFDNEIKEVKKLLRQSQLDHERTTADHGVAIREMQTLYSTERNKCENIENQFDECRAKIVTLETQLETVKKQNNHLNLQYQTKLNETKDKHSINEEELKQSKEKVLELTSKIKDLEAKYNEQLRVELKRNQQLEKKINDITSEYAQKMSTNETHIAELSEQIGVIEKQRAQDQIISQRLKERIAQLDVENSLLTKASSASIEHDDLDQTNDDDNHHDLDTLLKRISKLKVLIRVANDRFGKNLTIEDVLNIDREMSSGNNNSDGTNLSTENNKILHSKCQEEIDRLKNELEKYRSKTVAAFKAKTFKDTNSTKEIEDLRIQNDQLREKLNNSHSLYNSEHERHTQVVEKLESCLTRIREQHRYEMEQILLKKRAEINELESELEKQRERTVRLLSEKDREVETMKKQYDNSTFNDNKSSHSSSLDFKPVEESSTIVGELFPNNFSSSTIGGPLTPLNPENNNILYFIQEQQLREQELITLRKTRHELESTLRDLNKKHSFEINQLQTTIEQLNDDLENIKLRTQRNEILSKNEFNIDYIKNVFYHYLLSNDTQVKYTMANALMTVLHFSPKERAKIESQKTNTSLTSGNWFYSK